MTIDADDRFRDLELKAEVWLARESVPLERLLALQVGETLPLQCDPDGPVELVINGSTVATGELLVVDGRFAFRVSTHDAEKLDQARQDAAAGAGTMAFAEPPADDEAAATRLDAGDPPPSDDGAAPAEAAANGADPGRPGADSGEEKSR